MPDCSSTLASPLHHLCESIHPHDSLPTLPVSLLQTDEEFLRSVDKLQPAWNSTWYNELAYLQRFDDAGVLRPQHRVVAPEFLHIFLARRHHLPVEVPEVYDPVIDELLNEINGGSGRRGDPDALHPVERRDSRLSEYVVAIDRNDDGTWDDWWKTSHYVDDRPVRYPIAISYYGEWQRLRFVTLLEAYSFRALLDPREISPQKVFDPEWDRELRGKKLVWSTGDPRGTRIVEQLEQDGWLEKLYLTREWRNFAYTLAYHPQLADWAEGEALSPEERAEVVKQRVAGKLREHGAKWIEEEEDYLGRVRLLLELWAWAKKHVSEQFASVVRADLVAAVQWAYRLYDCDFRAFAERVGGNDFDPSLSLGAALTPVSDDARKTATNVLPQFVESFKQVCPRAALEASDAGAFVDYLEANELGSWLLEFGTLIAEMRKPTDSTLDKRFLHLRSLAILLEALLQPLVRTRGTPEDAARLAHWNVRESMKVFLGGRRDWRDVLWQCVSANWELTQVRNDEFANRLAALTDNNAVLCAAHPEHTTMARRILLQVALRNFGSHRFTNDRELLDQHFGDLFSSVVYCALFYWKVAQLEPAAV